MEHEVDESFAALRRDGEPELALAREVASLVRALGGRAWLVGGCVRDALLGRACHDFDLEVYGVPAPRLEAALAQRWPLDKVGASFGVVKLKHHGIDIALPRRENREGAGHRDFSVAADPALSPAEAAARRDFTVNAIMFDPLACEPLDPWGGISDLRAGVLRHVSEHFAEDPLRVLRGMQFLARLPFLSAAPETVALCATMTQEALPRERLAGEWEKLFLQGVRPSRGLEFLRACGWLRFYPELAALPGVPQDPVFHPEGDVWTHTLLALDAAAAIRGDRPREDALALAVSALCHDLGKPAATARGEDGRLHAYDHENLGVEPARAFVRRLWNQSGFEDLVARLVAQHMRPVQLVLSGAGDKAFRRLAVDVGRPDLLADVVECDVRATAAPGADPAAHESLAIVRAYRDKCAELAVEREPPKPVVLGRHLVARGLKPGPAFGPILDACYEAQLAGEIRDEAGGAAFLDALLADRARSAGQAMVEFVVGLVALLLVAVGLLAVAALVRADTDSFAQAQEEAVKRSMGNGTPRSFTPVSDVGPGADGLPLTKDDVTVHGSLDGVRRIAGHAAPAGAAWPERPDGGARRHDAVGALARGEGGDALFSMRRGDGEATVKLPPAARPLFGLGETATLRNEVWLPQTGGVE